MTAWQEFSTAFLFVFATTFSPPCDDGTHPTKHDAFIRSVAIANRLDWCKMKAQLVAENSSFSPYARSPAGAVGCAQFLPSTWKWLEERYNVRLDIFNCRDSIVMYGFRIRELIDNFTERGADDPEAFAYAAYNRGENGVLRTVRAIGKGFVWLAIRPALPTETVNYVARIRHLFGSFRNA